MNCSNVNLRKNILKAAETSTKRSEKCVEFGLENAKLKQETEMLAKENRERFDTIKEMKKEITLTKEF